LAEKTGKFLPKDAIERIETIQWLFFQMAGVGPMLGQFGHFYKYAPEKIEYAIQRYTKEAQRLLGVLEKRLEGRDYLIKEYSIADMATWPWIWCLDHYYKASEHLNLKQFPNVQAWATRCIERPASKKALAVTSF
jgi:GST-like protein